MMKFAILAALLAMSAALAADTADDIVDEIDTAREEADGFLERSQRAETVDEALDCLEFKIVRALNIVAPITRVRTQEHYAKWMTPELQEKILRRNAMRKKAETTRLKEDWMVHRNYQRNLSKELREARMADFKKDMDVKDPKQRWNAVKRNAGMCSKEGESTIELKEDGELLSDPKKVAVTLNEYFKTNLERVAI